MIHFVCALDHVFHSCIIVVNSVDIVNIMPKQEVKEEEEYEEDTNTKQAKHHIHSGG